MGLRDSSRNCLKTDGTEQTASPNSTRNFAHSDFITAPETVWKLGCYRANCTLGFQDSTRNTRMLQSKLCTLSFKDHQKQSDDNLSFEDSTRNSLKTGMLQSNWIMHAGFLMTCSCPLSSFKSSLIIHLFPSPSMLGSLQCAAALLWRTSFDKKKL